MSQFVFANNVKTTLASAAPMTSQYITLSSSANLPTLAAGQVMPLTLNDAATGLVYEIVYVTAITGASLTVIRGQEGTAAQNWATGDFAFVAPTAKTVAPVNGSPLNLFDVATAQTNTQALNKIAAQQLFAQINGNPSNEFLVAQAQTGSAAMPLSQATNLFLQPSAIKLFANSQGYFAIPANGTMFVVNWGFAAVQDDNVQPVQFSYSFQSALLFAGATASYNGTVPDNSSLSAYTGGYSLYGMNVGLTIPATTFHVNGAYWLAIGV